MLVVISVFGIIILVANQVFFSTLHGSNKSKVTTEVKQDANHTLSVIERNLHSATAITLCTSTQISYTDANGGGASFSCVNPGEDGYIASGSARLTRDSISVTSCSITCDQTGVTPSVSLAITFRQKGTQGLRSSEESTFQIQTIILLRN